MDYDFEQACLAHGIHTKPHSDDESDGGKSDFDDTHEQHKPDPTSLSDLAGRIVKIEPTLHTSSSSQSKPSSNRLEHLPNAEIANSFAVLSVNDRGKKEYQDDEKPKVKVELNDAIITVHETETIENATKHEGDEWQINTTKRAKKIASLKESKRKLDIYERAALLQPTLGLGGVATLTANAYTQGGNQDQKQVIENPVKKSTKKKKKKVSKNKVDVYEKILQDSRDSNYSVQSQGNNANLTRNTTKKEEIGSFGKNEISDVHERNTLLQSRTDQARHIDFASVVRDALFLATKPCKSDTQDFTATVFKVSKVTRKTLESVAHVHPDEYHSVSLALGTKGISQKRQINDENSDKQKHVINSQGCSKQLILPSVKQISDQKIKITENFENISQDHVDPCVAVFIVSKSSHLSYNPREKEICPGNNPSEAIEGSKQERKAIKNVANTYQGEKNEDQDQVHSIDCPESVAVVSKTSKWKKKKALKAAGEDNQIQFAYINIGQKRSLSQGHADDVNNDEKRKRGDQEQVYGNDFRKLSEVSKTLKQRNKKAVTATEKNNKLQFLDTGTEQVRTLLEEYLKDANKGEKRKIEGQVQVQVSDCQEPTVVSKASKRRKNKALKAMEEDNKTNFANTVALEQSNSSSQGRLEDVNMDEKQQSENKDQAFAGDNRGQQPNVVNKTSKQKKKKASKTVEINNKKQDDIEHTKTDKNLKQILAKQEEHLQYINLNAQQDQDSRQSTATISIASKRKKKKEPCFTSLINYHVDSQQQTIIKSKVSKRKKKKATLKAAQVNNEVRSDRSLLTVKPLSALKRNLDVTKHEEKALPASSYKNTNTGTQFNNALDSQRMKQSKPIKASVLRKEKNKQLKNKSVTGKLELGSKRSKENTATSVRQPQKQQKQKKSPTVTASKLSKQKRNTVEIEEIERLKRHFNKMQSLVHTFTSKSSANANHDNNPNPPEQVLQGTNAYIQVIEIEAIKQHLNQMQSMFDILTLAGKQKKVLKAKTGRTQLELTKNKKKKANAQVDIEIVNNVPSKNNGKSKKESKASETQAEGDTTDNNVALKKKRKSRKEKKTLNPDEVKTQTHDLYQKKSFDSKSLVEQHSNKIQPVNNENASGQIHLVDTYHMTEPTQAVTAKATKENPNKLLLSSESKRFSQTQCSTNSIYSTQKSLEHDKLKYRQDVGTVKDRLPPKENFAHKNDSKTSHLKCPHCRKMYDERDGHMCLVKNRFYAGPVEDYLSTKRNRNNAAQPKPFYDYVEPRYRECGQCWLIYDEHEGHMCRRPMRDSLNCTLQ